MSAKPKALSRLLAAEKQSSMACRNLTLATSGVSGKWTEMGLSDLRKRAEALSLDILSFNRSILAQLNADTPEES